MGRPRRATARGRSPPAAMFRRRRLRLLERGALRSGAPQDVVAPGADGGRAGGAVHEGRLAEGGAGRARGAN